MAMSNQDYQYFAMLAKRIKEGDDNAFTELYSVTYKVLYRYAYYFLREPDYIPDVLQEIYTSVYQNIGKLKIDRLLLPYIRQIAYHTCCDFAKKLKLDRHIHSSAYEEDLLPRQAIAQSEEDSLQGAHDRETRDRLHRALERCTPKERQAFLLRYENGLKLEEIADFMDVSLASVKRYIASAREVLQESFSA